MKTNLYYKKEDSFKPITMEITFESKDEIDTLFTILHNSGYVGSIPRTLKNIVYNNYKLN